MIPCSEDVLKIVDGDRTKEDEAEAPWPLLSEVELSGEKDEIEPGESEEFHFDFVIDPEIETVIVYSYVKNQIKRDREIGWNKTSVYDIK